MTKNVPNNYTKQQSINLRKSSKIQAEDFDGLADVQNFLFSHKHACWGGGYVFDPAFTTTSTEGGGGFTQTNETANGRDLDAIHFHGVIDRKLTRPSSANQGLVGVKIFGKGLQVQADIKKVEAGTSVTTLTTTAPDTSGYATGTSLRAISDFETTGDPVLLEAVLQAQIPSTSGLATGECWGIRVGGIKLRTTSDLPRGG